MEWTGLAIQCSSLRYEMIAARPAGFACRRHSGARDDRLRVHQPCIERVVVPDEISRREIRRIVVTVGCRLCGQRCCTGSALAAAGLHSACGWLVRKLRLTTLPDNYFKLPIVCSH